MAISGTNCSFFTQTAISAQVTLPGALFPIQFTVYVEHTTLWGQIAQPPALSPLGTLALYPFSVRVLQLRSQFCILPLHSLQVSYLGMCTCNEI